MIVTGIHWNLWKTFQDKWIAAGYVILEDPLRVCIGDCHLPPVPKSPSLPDYWESPIEPVSPFPFRDPVPRQLPPGYTELKPFDAKPSDPILGRVTPRVTPSTGPNVRPKPTPRPDEDDRRKNPCEPHLHLPFGKTIHTERYGLEIVSSRLKAAPTALDKNRQGRRPMNEVRIRSRSGIPVSGR